MLTKLFRRPAPAQLLAEPPIEAVKPSPLPPVYRSFAEAAEACGDGYEDAELVSFMRARLDAAVRTGADFSYLPTMQLIATIQAASVAAESGRLNCLDVGGQFGVQKHFVEQATGLKTRWAIVETPAVVRASEDQDDLRFFNTTADAANWLGEVDLLNLSGVIQYLQSASAVLAGFLEHSPRYVSITRTPLSQSDVTYDVQRSRLHDNGFGPAPEGYTDREVRYPRILWRKQDILEAFGNYRLLWSAAEGPHDQVGAVAVVENHAMLFQRC